MEIRDIDTVHIDEHRWDVGITITHKDGTTQRFIASADSGFTDNNGIFFGTAEEWDEVYQELMN